MFHPSTTSDLLSEIDRFHKLPRAFSAFSTLSRTGGERFRRLSVLKKILEILSGNDVAELVSAFFSSRVGTSIMAKMRLFHNSQLLSDLGQHQQSVSLKERISLLSLVCDRNTQDTLRKANFKFSRQSLRKAKDMAKRRRENEETEGEEESVPAHKQKRQRRYQGNIEQFLHENSAQAANRTVRINDTVVAVRNLNDSIPQLIRNYNSSHGSEQGLFFMIGN